MLTLLRRLLTRLTRRPTLDQCARCGAWNELDYAACQYRCWRCHQAVLAGHATVAFERGP